MPNAWIVFAVIVAMLVVGSHLKAKSDIQKCKSMGLYPETSNASIEDVKRLLINGYKVQAIKLYREIYDVGLKEAKDEVEKIEEKLLLTK